MLNTSLAAMAKLFGVDLPQQDVVCQGLSTDTRTLQPNNLFIALQGPHFNGHHFIAEAANKGASAALVNQPVAHPLPQLVVPDTLLALGKLAANWRAHFTLPLIGVTGSNGKTTLKNMLAAILRAACNNVADAVLATEGNLNNNIGLPLTLAHLKATHRYAVIEMGMNHFGEIEYLTQITKPTIAVITNAAAAHLAGVGDIAGVAKAKGEIFSGLAEQGTAILNRDDPHFSYWKNLIGKRSCLTFGLAHSADVTAKIMEGQKITLQTPAGNIMLTLPLLGKHNVMNALAATAAALAANVDLATIKTGLETMQPAPSRMQQYILANNIKIIDDTYNANPFSLQAAVETLAHFPETKIVVLGDMKELGEQAVELHFTAGEKIRAAGIDHLFTLGDLSSKTCAGFGKSARHFTERETLIAALKPHLTQNVAILVKGSRSMQMERIIAALIPKEQLADAH